jgi:[ribosomal protein S5]-alanine N-acetyltransferase
MVEMVETQRLKITPLTYEQLLKYRRNDQSLELEMNLNKTSRVISSELAEALDETIIPNTLDESRDLLYNTLWAIILKEENKMVGDLCFIGDPNLEGEVEIGYGTYPEFQGKGYMTEAIGGMIKWAFEQPIVKIIIARTDKNNLASTKVLQKNKFKRFEASDHLLLWKLRIHK